MTTLEVRVQVEDMANRTEQNDQFWSPRRQVLHGDEKSNVEGEAHSMDVLSSLCHCYTRGGGSQLLPLLQGVLHVSSLVFYLNILVGITILTFVTKYYSKCIPFSYHYKSYD